jgi:hypothetical protein
LGDPTVQCDNQHPLQVADIEELSTDALLMRCFCDLCGYSFGVEGKASELDLLVPGIMWTDEALYHLSRLPPYLSQLVCEEVEAFASVKHQRIVTFSRFGSARNKGMVSWDPDAERRLDNVPSGIRAMARTELERTALDRGMPSVTVELMEEVKTRYFGMAAGRS